MSTRATDDTLGSLHGVLASHFVELLTKGVQEIDKEGNSYYRRASASELSVIRQFLKDNGIEAQAPVGSALGSLAVNLPFPEAGEELYLVKPMYQ